MFVGGDGVIVQTGLVGLFAFQWFTLNQLIDQIIWRREPKTRSGQQTWSLCVCPLASWACWRVKVNNNCWIELLVCIYIDFFYICFSFFSFLDRLVSLFVYIRYTMKFNQWPIIQACFLMYGIMVILRKFNILSYLSRTTVQSYMLSLHASTVYAILIRTVI